MKRNINKKIGAFLLGALVLSGGINISNADTPENKSNAYSVYFSQSLTGHSFATTLRSELNGFTLLESITGESSHKSAIVTAPSSGNAQLRSNTAICTKGKTQWLTKTSSTVLNTSHKQRYSVTKYDTRIKGAWENY